MQPRIYIARPHAASPGLFTLFYLEQDREIYGWHLETKERYFSAAFFMIENFYSRSAVHLYRSLQDDVYCPWIIDYPPTRHELIRCPAPEPLRHELERLQSRFVGEWLFFKDDPQRSGECREYASHGLPLADVNIRWKKMGRLEKRAALWSYQQGADPNIVAFLRKCWRLSEKMPARH